MSFRHWSALCSCLLLAGLASSAAAAETSSCVTCHLDERMLLENLGATKARKSALQSGAG
jgi:hypothetical protein